MSVIAERTAELLMAVEAIHESERAENDKMWTALRGVAGLDGVAAGVAQIRAVLAPLRLMVTPSTALPLEPGVAGALAEIRAALGGRRDTNFPSMTTDWDGPVGIIGAAGPAQDPTDPGTYRGYDDEPTEDEEQVS
jgi:hypothetical protein